MGCFRQKESNQSTRGFQLWPGPSGGPLALMTAWQVPRWTDQASLTDRPAGRGASRVQL